MQRTRGVSLAKGPIALIGLLGIIYGVTALIVRAHGFALNFPSGHVQGPFWLHLKVNGWTALLFIAAGLALLFSAAAHITAKSMAMLVGVVMIVLAVIAFSQKHGALGIFAADHWTELVWAAAGVALLVLAMMPRVGGHTTEPAPVPRTTTGAERTAVREDRGGVTPREQAAREDRGGVTPREQATREDPGARREPVDERTSTSAGNQSATRDEPLIRGGQPVPNRDEE
jgi:hypothetical protein